MDLRKCEHEGAADAATPPLSICGTTTQRNPGTTDTIGMIHDGSAVRLDDGGTVTGTGSLTVNGTFQLNRAADRLATISNTAAFSPG